MELRGFSLVLDFGKGLFVKFMLYLVCFDINLMIINFIFYNSLDLK